MIRLVCINDAVINKKTRIPVKCRMKPEPV